MVLDTRLEIQREGENRQDSLCAKVMASNSSQEMMVDASGQPGPEGMSLCLLMSQSGNVRLPGGPTPLAPSVDPTTPSLVLEAQSCADTKCAGFEDERAKGACRLQPLDSRCPQGCCKVTEDSSTFLELALGPVYFITFRLTFSSMGYCNLKVE